MDATELRIGNLVKDPYNKIIKLVSVEKDASMLRPIPLIEERILELGMLKWKNKNIWTKKGVMIYFHSIDGYCYGKANNRTKLKYVHSLQNLYFALKNEEINI